MGVFEIRTSETLHNDEKIITIFFIFDENGDLKLQAAYVNLFTIEESITSVNILRSVISYYIFIIIILLIII